MIGFNRWHLRVNGALFANNFNPVCNFSCQQQISVIFFFLFSCFLNITERSQRGLKRSIVFVWLCCRNQLNWWLYPTDNAAGKSEVKLIFSASSQRETGAGEELKVSKDKDNFFVSLCSNPPHYFLIIAKLLTKKQVKQNTQHIKKNKCMHITSAQKESVRLCPVFRTVRSDKFYWDGEKNHTELLMKIMLCWPVTPDPTHPGSAVCYAYIRTVVPRQLLTPSCESKSRPVAQHRRCSERAVLGWSQLDSVRNGSATWSELSVDGGTGPWTFVVPSMSTDS